MHADAAGKGGQGFLQLRVAPGQRRELREGRLALFAIEIQGLGGGFAGHGAGVRRHQGGDGVWAVDGVDQGQLLQPGEGGEQLLPLLGCGGSDPAAGGSGIKGVGPEGRV